MKRLLFALCLVLVSSGAGVALPPAESADEPLTTGDYKIQQIRHFYSKGAVAISESLAIQHQGTQLFELISIELHLSAAGGAGDFTMIKNSGLGSEYDAVWLTQDMTSVTDLVVLYEPNEAIFSNLDTIDFAWANGSSRTYGLTVKYKLR